MNPCDTLGGNPTRPLEEHPTTIVLAVHVDEDEAWQGVYAFKTWRRCALALRPTVETHEPDSDWSRWDCQGSGCFPAGTYLVCRDQVG